MIAPRDWKRAFVGFGLLSVALRLAILLHVVAAAFVSAMALIQNVNIAFMRPRILAAADDARQAGLVDAGSALALWYLAVIILAARRPGTPPLGAAEAPAS